MNVRAWLSFAACGVGLLLGGCGGRSAPPAPVVPAVSPLAGNWLIVGPMPTNGAGVSTGFRLALTFDVKGSNVTAAGFGNDACGENSQSSFGFGSLATGTIAADGSFSLQTPANFGLGSMAIQGAVPKASGSSWTGNYTISFDGAFPIPATCATSLIGTFTASPFPFVSGVYSGTGSSQTIVNGVATTTPVTFQATLQQGGTATTGQGTLTSNSALTGSIRVQGSPCFSSGVTGGIAVSAVEGNQVLMQFTMDDGSTLSMTGTLVDASETRMTTNVALVNGGNCGTNPRIYSLPELDLQS